MITLHFSPQFDSGAWSGEPAKGSCKIEESYVGPMGLLNFLEVKLGITAQEKPQHEIVAAYTKAAQSVSTNNPTIFFAQSLELTPLATAGELLRWRDELVLAGWKADTPIPEKLTTGAQAILRGLAKVEASLPPGFRTTADRWQALLTAMANATSIEGFSVKVHVKETHLHPVHKRILDGLKRCNIPVESVIGGNVPTVDIKHFHDSSDACLWTAAQDGNDLQVCSDNQTLSSAMAAFGRPYGNATASETPRPIAHLFTSAMMLLKDGGNIQAFRDYLSAPSHPLNKYENDKKNLRKALLDNIIRQHGFGGTDKIVEEYAAGDPDLLAEIRTWIPAAGQPLTFDRIKAMCNRISDWANREIKAVENKGEDSPYLDQWQELVSACEEMEFQCMELGLDRKPVIAEQDFIQILRNVSEPSPSIARRAVVDSVPVVPSIECIAEDVQDVIWVDGSFVGSPIPLPFLCPKDAEELRSILPYVWPQNDALQLTEDLFYAGLSHICGKLTILYCDTFTGKKREKHPFILRQVEKVDDLSNLPYEQLPDKKSEPCQDRPIEPIPEECALVIDGLALPDHESPTSLESMFEQPLDWVLKSILHLYEENDSNESMIKGLVAHDTIHRIYEKAARACSFVTADAFEQVFNADFDTFFSESLQATGAELTLPENKLDCEQFKSNLKTLSIPKLVEIIRHSDLTIVGSEVKSENVKISIDGFDPIQISGNIDLLLKNPAGNYVILDFKWAGKAGRHLREDQIKKGEDYQLALYRKMVETGTDSIPQGTVAAQAFFMLRSAELLTAYPVFNDKQGMVAIAQPGSRTHQNTYEETLAIIFQKYSEVVQDFNDGRVSAGNLKDQYLHFKVLKGKLD